MKAFGLACVTTLVISALAPGCMGVRRTPHPKLSEDVDRLMNDVDVLPPFPVPAAASGSLWTDGGPGAALARDARAFRTNDLLTIRLDERSLGTNESNTDLARRSEASVGAGVAFGLEDATPSTGSFNLNQVLESSFDTNFAGDGSTSRSSQITGRITTRVLRVLPNGDLVIAGQKTIMVNRERQVLTLVGSVRPLDIDSDNEVASSSVGDLTVRMWGQGEVDGTVRQGWFMKVLNRFWPF
jgi:flagellar L-ring protein precursor FlgH